MNELARRLLRPFGIPAITPRALGLFRALFGLGLLVILVERQPIRPIPADEINAHSPLARMAWVEPLATNASAMTALQTIGCASALLFALGVFARPAYTVLAAVLFLHVVTMLAKTGTHDWSLPLVTCLGLLLVPWSEAPAAWRLWRRDQAADHLRSRAYGFAVWLPGLTLGLAFAAAAYAKVGDGWDWVANGSVRYHFVEDGHDAPVTWGLWIATQPGIAVALSLGAVIVEALFVLVVFVRAWLTRALFGLAGGALMAGFTLFQGVAWWPWRLLFLAFLPWNYGEPAGSDRQGRRDLNWAHAGLVGLLLAAQVWASARAVEIEPLVSHFPMYSHTYASPEEYERAHERVRFEWEDEDLTERVDAAGGYQLLLAMVGAGAERQVPDGQLAALAAFAEEYRRRHGEAPPTIEVVRVRRPFDWEEGRYLPEMRALVGTVRLPAGDEGEVER